MYRISILSDFLIRSFFIFLIAYLWAGYFIRGFALSFLTAFFITTLVNVGIMALHARKSKRRQMTRERLDHMQTIALQFKFMPQAQSALFLADLIPPSSDYQVFSLLHKSVTESDIVEALNRTFATKKTIIIAQDFDPRIRAFFSGLRLNIELVNFEMLYDEILEPKQVFPPITVEKKANTRFKWREFHNLFFNRRKAKSFLLVGIFIMFTSLIVRPSLYYIIIASLVFGVAIVGFLRPRINNQFLASLVPVDKNPEMV